MPWCWQAGMISTSGMRAGFSRLDAVAANIANILTTGPVPATPPGEPVRMTGSATHVFAGEIELDGLIP